MNILILNWRDPTHPSSGGAEVLTHEMASRWVRSGHTVTWCAASYPGAPGVSKSDGVTIRRMGRWWTVHLLAGWWYLIRRDRDYDIVLDEVHWFPFWSILYARRKTVALICEVAHELFPHEAHRTITALLQWMEKIYIRLYRDIPAITISQSTRKALVAHGYRDERITVLPMGVTLPEKLPTGPKASVPTIIFLGRIHRLKGIEDALDAFRTFRKNHSGAVLWIVGTGEPQYVRYIREKVRGLGLTQSVRFWGKVPEPQKFTLLSQAHVLVAPSVQEGWGPIVPEAAAVGTPAIVYNVPGLRDVVRELHYGMTCEPDPEALARALSSYFSVPRGAAQKPDVRKIYSWDRTAGTGLAVFEAIRNTRRGSTM